MPYNYFLLYLNEYNFLDILLDSLEYQIDSVKNSFLDSMDSIFEATKVYNFIQILINEHENYKLFEFLEVKNINFVLENIIIENDR